MNDLNGPLHRDTGELVRGNPFDILPCYYEKGVDAFYVIDRIESTPLVTKGVEVKHLEERWLDVDEEDEEFEVDYDAWPKKLEPIVELKPISQGEVKDCFIVVRRLYDEDTRLGYTYARYSYSFKGEIIHEAPSYNSYFPYSAGTTTFQFRRKDKASLAVLTYKWEDQDLVVRDHCYLVAENLELLPKDEDSVYDFVDK